MGKQPAIPLLWPAYRSRLELGECLQAGCLQGGDGELEHGGEAYSLNKLLREEEDGFVDAVNPLGELRGTFEKYTPTISMFLLIQYAIIRIMLFAVFFKCMKCLSSSGFCCLQCSWTCTE